MVAWLRNNSLLSGLAIASTLILSVGSTEQVGAAEATSSFSDLSAASTPDVPPLGTADRYLPEAAEVHLVLRLRERRVYVYQGETVLASYPVAIGTSQTPTPTGTFEVFQLVENPIWQSPWTGKITAPGPNSALGLRWIGFASMSNGIIGFHGTPTVNSIGHAASNGCVRMYNHDVVAMFNQVKMGTTVIVE
ncbi:MAG: L,D-transpeptidase [Spirulinaceae cyanobacterium SM2_1_0]|nr:L,D-transpeptidase [Spirulinaceae cyanobacterium SM2_1_0]